MNGFRRHCGIRNRLVQVSFRSRQTARKEYRVPYLIPILYTKFTRTGIKTNKPRTMTSPFQPFTNVTNQSKKEEGTEGFASWSKDPQRSNKISSSDYVTPTNQNPPTFGFQFGSASAAKGMNSNSRNVSTQNPFSFEVSQSSSASKSIFSPPVSSLSYIPTVANNNNNSEGFQSPNPGFRFGSQTTTTTSHATTTAPTGAPIVPTLNHTIDNLSMEQAASNLGLRRRVPLSVQTASLHSTTRSTPKSLPPKQSRLGQRNINYTSSDAIMKNDLGSTTEASSGGGGIGGHFLSSSTTSSPITTIPKASRLLSSLTKPLTHKKMIQYNTWVVIYGVTAQNLSMVLSKFSSLGTVLSKYPSLSEISNGTNWIALEYKSYLEAEKALCQNNSILDLGHGQVIVLGVVPVNEQLAINLKLKNFMELGSTGVERLAVGDDTYDNGTDGKKQLNSEGTKVWSEEDVLYKGDNVGHVGKGVEDEDENASGPKNKTCEKFMKWVFSW